MSIGGRDRRTASEFQAAWVCTAFLVLLPHTLCAEVQPASGSDGSDSGVSTPLTANAPVDWRCGFVKGAWCKQFHSQTPVAWKPPPRGDKPCPTTKWGVCNNVGNCNHDTGYCECTAGWKGTSCEKRQKRPCTDGYSDPDSVDAEPRSFLDANKRDRDLTKYGWTYSRCAGVCDDDLAACYCDGPFGRIPAPDDAPPGTPPARRGRPLVTMHMAPKTTWDGKKAAHGEQEYDSVYGPQGYCNASNPKWSAVCSLDDLNGPGCDVVTEAFCPNQCSGHGYCNLGYCKCDEGYYGNDCSRRKAGMPLLPSRIPTTPHLKASVVDPPAAMEPPPKPTRVRPLIFVYDLEPLYAARLLQYRISSTWCVHRRYDERNNTFFTDNWVYAVDTLFYESLLQSPHRTFDPEEADFFYVPHQASCYPFPIMNWADYPYFPAPGGPRVMHMANILRHTLDFIRTQYPFWNRRNGRDHLWLFTHDEGACWVPSSLTNSTWLTHWGRTDPDHKCNTAFVGDRYDTEHKSRLQPEGWLKYIQGHACYREHKDLVVPSFKSYNHYRHSPLAGAPPKPRDIFFFFRGDVGKGRFPNYSRGVRQKLHRMAQGKYANSVDPKVLVGYPHEVAGDYSDQLARSRFCLVAPGDGWSGRMEDAVLHGCIPVIIMDGVHAVFESILDVELFSVRVKQEEVDNIIDILKALPQAKVHTLQTNIGRVWHRYRWGVGTALVDALRGQLNAAGGAGAKQPSEGLTPQPFKGDPALDDAFATTMQWLHSRIPATR